MQVEPAQKPHVWHTLKATHNMTFTYSNLVPRLPRGLLPFITGGRREPGDEVTGLHSTVTVQHFSREMIMETKETQWLQKYCQEAEVSGPATKRVKYEAIHSGISADFPDKTISTKVLSDALKSTFPKTINKRYGYDRSTYIFGLEALPLQELDRLSRKC